MNIIKNWNGREIRIRQEDRYVCITDIAKATGKRTNDWARTKESAEYLQALEAALGTIAGKSAMALVADFKDRDGTPSTWAHPKVAIRFAQWCSAEFSVQVDFWLDELLSTGSVSVEKEEENFVALPEDMPNIGSLWNVRLCDLRSVWAYRLLTEKLPHNTQAFLLEDLSQSLVGLLKALPIDTLAYLVAAAEARELRQETLFWCSALTLTGLGQLPPSGVDVGGLSQCATRAKDDLAKFDADKQRHDKLIAQFDSRLNTLEVGKAAVDIREVWTSVQRIKHLGLGGACGLEFAAPTISRRAKAWCFEQLGREPLKIMSTYVYSGQELAILDASIQEEIKLHAEAAKEIERTGRYTSRKGWTLTEGN
jgi:KilA-N domain